MEFLDYLKLGLSIVSGLLVVIPLVRKVCQLVKELVTAKNYDKLLKIVMRNMAKAEELFDNGEERKQWVMSLLQEAAIEAKYDLKAEDVSKISEMVDAICDIAKVLTAKTAEANVTRQIGFITE